jgi:hypothetical protein
MHKLNTDIHVATCYVCLYESVLNDCINHASGSAVEATSDGQQPKVSTVHRVASMKGASRTSFGKNGRWVLHECPVRMKEYKRIYRLFIAGILKKHINFVEVVFSNIQNLIYITIGVGTNESIRTRMKRWTFV